MNTQPTTLKNPITAICDEFHINRTTLALQSGIPYNTLSQIASGHVLKISETNAEKLSVFANCPMTEIQDQYLSWLAEYRTLNQGHDPSGSLAVSTDELRFKRMSQALSDEDRDLVELTIQIPRWMIKVLQTMTDPPSVIIYRALVMALKFYLRRLITFPPQTTRIPDDDPRAPLIRVMHKYHRRTNLLARARLITEITYHLQQLGVTYDSEADAVVQAERIFLEYSTTPVAMRLGIPDEIQQRTMAPADDGHDEAMPIAPVASDDTKEDTI